MGVPAQVMDGRTALHWVAREGYVEALLALVALGADPRTPDVYGCTPLHVAAEKGLVEAVRALVDLGADPRALDMNGAAPLHHAATLSEGMWRFSKVLGAVKLRGTDSLPPRGENW